MAQKTEILIDLSSTGSRAIVLADDDRHPVVDHDIHWAETSWWAFMNPADLLSGWIYLTTRPELGVASLGVWIWDAGGRLEPWRLAYSKAFAHVPLDPDYSLRDLRFADHGFHLESVNAFQRYRLRYHPDDAIELLMQFDAVVPPQPMGTGESTGHFDQGMWATGTVRLGPDVHTIDAAGFRDRTWSSRPEFATERANCYSWAASDAIGFQLLVMFDRERPIVSGGYLHRDGSAAPLVNVQRTVVERDADSEAPTMIAVELTDATGRTCSPLGRCVNRAVLPGFAGYMTFASMVEWSIDGETVWGEDHDSWPHSIFRARFG